VLRYNGHTAAPPGVASRIDPANRKYAVARSGYIHPLVGPGGAVLTADWPVDHPHHRGVYWAWPEVEFGTRRGDLHALQHVFSRPTGRVALREEPGAAVMRAENLWWWEDGTAVVRETVVIRVQEAVDGARAADLALRFEPLVEGVTLARRETRLYGGLNVRMATPRGQEILVQTDPEGSTPRRAWSDLSGVYENGGACGLLILQHRDNPDYPGEWVRYPELSWCQPTFPAPGSRHALRRGEALRLRYRLWMHAGRYPGDARAAAVWDDFHSRPIHEEEHER